MAQITNISLILARDLASKLATPMFLASPDGTLVYYNEPAERVLGRRFAESGPLSREDWSTIFTPSDPNGTAIPPDQLPLGIALLEHRAAHRSMVITGLDGVQRTVEVTAVPIMPHPDQLVGALALLWETE
jgi:hypothetical protein